MANVFYFLGDIASKPMHWDWMNSDTSTVEWICGVNYAVYNWLMTKSYNFDLVYETGVWVANIPEDND